MRSPDRQCIALFRAFGCGAMERWRRGEKERERERNVDVNVNVDVDVCADVGLHNI